MPRRPKHPVKAWEPTISKVPKADLVYPKKTPRIGQEPDYWQSSPSWRVSMMQMRDPFGWHELDERNLHRIRDKLTSFESMTWSGILVDGKKQNHSIDVRELDKVARDRLMELGLDEIEEVISLRLGARERIFGLRQDTVLQLLWWDPDHQVSPCEKKHT